MLNTFLNKSPWFHGGEQREESQQNWEAPSVFLMRNDCGWDTSDGGRGKRCGWVSSLRVFIVSKVYKKTKESNLMSNGRNTKDKVGIIMIFFFGMRNEDWYSI